MDSKSVGFLRQLFLIDPESGKRARIVHVEAAESGHDHVRIWSQSTVQRRAGVATMHKVYSEEVEATND